MLKHCVFVKFAAHHPSAERTRVLGGFGEVARDVPVMLDFCFGENLDFENKSDEYGDGFIVTFQDRSAHLAYERHPLHLALGAELVAMCEGGHDGIMVFDLEIEPPRG